MASIRPGLGCRFMKKGVYSKNFFVEAGMAQMIGSGAFVPGLRRQRLMLAKAGFIISAIELRVHIFSRQTGLALWGRRAAKRHGQASPGAACEGMAGLSGRFARVFRGRNHFSTRCQLSRPAISERIRQVSI